MQGLPTRLPSPTNFLTPNGRQSIPNWLVLLLIGLFSLAANFLYIHWIGKGAPVVPAVHDEFSYLLAGDTFSKGRLSNPPHPLWEYFESMHVYQQPTYGSKYQPGQGLMLAVGSLLGHPHRGILLEGALAPMAVYYLLTACVSRGWAIAGTLLAIFHRLSLEWACTYWGGYLAVIGGALILGALIRGYRAPAVGDGFLLGLGVSTLALSRPFEGVVYTGLCFLFTAVALWRAGTVRPFLRSITPGFATVLALTACWMAYYNFRTTGNPSQMPYMVYEKTYLFSPLFLWQKAPPPIEYRHEKLTQYAASCRAAHAKQRTLSGFLAAIQKKFSRNAPALLGNWLLVLPLAAALYTSRKRPELRSAFLLIALFVLCELTVVWMMPHYLGCLLGLILLLAIIGYQELINMGAAGRWIAALAFLATLGVGFFLPIPGLNNRFRSKHIMVQRHQLIERLNQTPGKHLLLVSYAPDHSFHKEWVYNGADVDGSKVVFARSMNDNSRLLEYYKDRTVWNLVVGQRSYELTPLKSP